MSEVMFLDDTILEDLRSFLEKLDEQEAVLRNRIQQINIKDVLNVHQDDVDSDIVRLPSLLYNVHDLYAEARQLLEFCTFIRDVIYARLYLYYRSTQHPSGKVTESTLESLVTTHPGYQDVMMRLSKLKYLVVKLDGLVQSVVAKRDMLISLAANIRTLKSSLV